MKPLLLTFNLLCGADAATTHIGLAHGGTGTFIGREVLLPTQNPYVIDALVAGQAVGTSLGVRFLDQHGHPRAARIVGWIAVGARVLAVAHNIQTLRKLR